MSDLRHLKCVPCRGGIPPLSPDEIERLRPQVADWQVTEQDGIPRLVRTFRVKGFTGALDLANRIGQIAESEDHHPALLVEYGRVTVSWWTHAIRGLHQNDFIMAAKTDHIVQSLG